jgi:hypothetical protein
MTAQECAISEFKKLAGIPGVPGGDKVYKARIDSNTFIAIYVIPGPADASVLQAHLVSAAGGTHCVQVHISKAASSKGEVEPWFRGFGKAKFEPDR